MPVAEKFLNPEAIKANLMLSSLYLAAYEVLRSSIIDNIKDFFTFEYVSGKPKVDEQYKAEVSNRHKDVFYASCLWLENAGVIDSDDVQDITKIRRHRNQIAHELPRLLSESDLELNLDYFLQIKKLLEKIEIWWVRNVEMVIHTDFDGTSVENKDIHPGRVIALDYLISVALSDYLEDGATYAE